MLNDFANEIEEIIHLIGGSNATLAQVRQDLAVIVERMRAAQQPRTAGGRVCTCENYEPAEMVDGTFCKNCGMPARR